MKKIIVLATLGTFIFLFSCLKEDSINTDGSIFYGEQGNLGGGTVRSYVTFDYTGSLTSIGFNFTESMLQNLPAVPGMGNMVMLDLPAEAAGSGFKHLELDWNPNGHDPFPIYGFPHFDFHFYLVGMDELDSITGGPDMTPVESQFIPKDYSSGIMAIPKMGVHWTDSLSSEFHSAQFTHTFIYGFYKSKLLFVEPMITKAFLDSKVNIILPVKQPEAFQKPGYYPSSYQINYDPTNHEYNVSLVNLSKHG